MEPRTWRWGLIGRGLLSVCLIGLAISKWLDTPDEGGHEPVAWLAGVVGSAFTRSLVMLTEFALGMALLTPLWRAAAWMTVALASCFLSVSIVAAWLDVPLGECGCAGKLADVIDVNRNLLATGLGFMALAVTGLPSIERSDPGA